MGRHSDTKSTLGKNMAIGALAVALTGGGVAALSHINTIAAPRDGATTAAAGGPDGPSGSGDASGDTRVTAAGTPDGASPATATTAATPAPTGPPCASGRHVAVTTTPDMAAALARIANAAEQRAGAACVRYDITAAPAGVTADKLLVANQKSPDIWVPDSGTWVDEVAQEAHLDVSLGPVVAVSPVGLALPKPLVDAGARTGRHTWAELVQGAHQSMSASDPEYSTASMLALASAATAAKPYPKFQQALTANLSAIARNVRDDDELMQRAAAGSPGSTAFPASEQQMAAERSDPRTQPVSALTVPDDRLTFQYGVVAFPGGGAPAKDAADALRAEMTSAGGQQVLRQAGFRVPGDATGPGVPGMDPTPAQVSATPVAMTHAEFEAHQQAWNAIISTLRGIIAIDVSGSMRQKITPTTTRIQLATTATNQALTALSGKAIVGLWAFSNKIGPGGAPYKELAPVGELEDPPAGGGAKDQRSRLTAIATHLPTMTGGGTALYDTISAAVKQVQAGYDPTHTNAVVVWTDGVNRDGGTLTEQQLLDQLRAVARSDRPVRVLMVGMGADSDMKVLTDIAQASGGSAFAAKDSEALSSVLQTLLTGRVERAGATD